MEIRRLLAHVYIDFTATEMASNKVDVDENMGWSYGQHVFWKLLTRLSHI